MLLPCRDDKAHFRTQLIEGRQYRYEKRAADQDMLVYRLSDFSVDQELMHLVDVATFLLLVMVLGMLIIDMPVFGTSLLHKTNAIEMVMMKYESR